MENSTHPLENLNHGMDITLDFLGYIVGILLATLAILAIMFGIVVGGIAGFRAMRKQYNTKGDAGDIEEGEELKTRVSTVYEQVFPDKSSFDDSEEGNW